MKRRSIIKTILLIFADIIFLLGSWCLAIFLSSYLYREYDPLTNVILQNSYIWIVYYLMSFWIAGVYRSMWQHIGMGTVIRLITATVACNFATYCALKILTGVWANPAIGVLAFFFMLILSGGIRVGRLVWENVLILWGRLHGKVPVDQIKPIRVLIVGAGESASTLLLQLNKHTEGSRKRRVFTIVDNDTQKHGYYLHGILVEGNNSLIPALVDKYGIEEVLVAVPSITNSDMQEIIKFTPLERCKVRVLKPFAKQAALPQEILKDLEISDLLERPEMTLDTEGILGWIRGGTVLVTGGGGSIGSELCRQLMRFEPDKIVIYDLSENNAYNLQQEMVTLYGQAAYENVIICIGSVTDEKRVDSVLSEYKPSVIFHAAAFKHVPLMEDCPGLAIENNVIGTRTMGLAAIRHGVKRFVHISTDKAVNPTNVMGASKRMAELVIGSLNARRVTEFVAVRFGNVLGSNGSVIPLFRRQIEMGGPITVTHPDIIRYFMTIPEAARLVIQAGAIAKGGEIFILDMGDPVKIVDLAENLIRIAGLIPRVDIKIEYTGLRPGEKLYEELLLETEGIAKTQKDKIYVASPTDIPINLESEIAEDFKNYSDTMALINKYVPEYRKGDNENAEIRKNKSGECVRVEGNQRVSGQNSGSADAPDDVRTPALF